jgi:hypothetical protein
LESQTFLRANFPLETPGPILNHPILEMGVGQGLFIQRTPYPQNIFGGHMRIDVLESIIMPKNPNISRPFSYNHLD